MNNTNCGYNDITNIHVGGADHRVCAAKCEATANCVGYTWHGRTSDWSVCWLKHAVKHCRPKQPGSCSYGTCISAVLSNECTDQEKGNRSLVRASRIHQAKV